ncbi:MAG: DevR family CRISPR-associated autoregulator [Deltaproteobacteria bacterium]|jgi:CRISPR-associated protein Cst2|nr:DevR family CRISPR-associated autoregulator [Deltaproteobacteria bacterium]MCL5879302.1 DevR family CRISPR-associated autoregulator [Deltaproteobacteria bacterium]MDA8305068.1 DevR family CRISPR-associated autoregulator [Deltaproteobacteria bacterium]
MGNKQLTHVVGTFLIQAEGAFLNGAGTEPYGQGDITMPKTFKTLREGGGQTQIPYVSSQAWKRWLRDTFQEENPSEPKLQILTTDVNKQNNTNKVGAEVDPVNFAEADIFGFMKAEKGQGKTKEAVTDEDNDIDQEPVKDNSKGKEKVRPSIRTSPFQSSILVSLRKTGWEGIDNGYVHPKGLSQEVEAKHPDANPTPLPYNTKFYNTQLQGIFGLSYSRLGVFRCEGDRIEIDQSLITKYLNEKKIELHPDFPGRKIYRTINNPRKDRATKILMSLAVMRGGAKQAQFGTPVHPQILIIAGISSGNLIFNNIFEDSPNGPKIKIETLDEILKDYSTRLSSNIYIGIRTGYLEVENEKKLREWAPGKKYGKRMIVKDSVSEEYDNEVKICTPIEAANEISEELPA